jgi:hypothetical protein
VPNFAYGFLYSDIVVTDIWLEPLHPQVGDKVSINISVYNGGTVQTDQYASIVTVGFFVDGELRKITELGNIMIGESNKITISTEKFWDTEWGKHKFTAIIDYHDTLPDSIDNPKNNNIEKIIEIIPEKDVTLNFIIDPQYVIPTTVQTVTFHGSLLDKDSKKPLSSQQLILSIDGKNSTLTTDKNGEFLLTKIIQIPQNTKTSLYYDGMFPYASIRIDKTLYVIPEKFSSSLVLMTDDPKLDFLKNNFDVVIFQDSYDDKFTTVKSFDSGSLLDSNTLWVPLQDGHSYLGEIYLEGRYFTTIDWFEAQKSQVIEKLIPPTDYGLIRFHVSDKYDLPISNISVKNWIYSSNTDNLGLTEWIDTITTVTKNEPYVAYVTIDGKTYESNPFLVSSGEKKIIEITVPYSMDDSIKLPQWIRNNAQWWSQDSISTEEFSNGIKYLVEQKILVLPYDSPSSEIGHATIPLWIKQMSGWWANHQVSDNDFISSIQYLIKIGVIRL